MFPFHFLFFLFFIIIHFCFIFAINLKCYFKFFFFLPFTHSQIVSSAVTSLPSKNSQSSPSFFFAAASLTNIIVVQSLNGDISTVGDMPFSAFEHTPVSSPASQTASATQNTPASTISQLRTANNASVQIPFVQFRPKEGMEIDSLASCYLFFHINPSITFIHVILSCFSFFVDVISFSRGSVLYFFQVSMKPFPTTFCPV